jgi:hypothetical protein
MALRAVRYLDKAAGSDSNDPGCRQARAKTVANEKLMSPPPRYSRHQ